MSSKRPMDAPGPFKVNQLRSGDRYELSSGHAYYCAPTGGDGARRTGAAFEVIDSDPLVEDAGIDPGFTPDDGTLRAPDVALGVPDAPGWIKGAPPLAVEYAGRGQDEDELQLKIRDLLHAGTRWIWVVRLVGPRRVEVYEPHIPVTVKNIDEVLEAPGVLRNAVPVRALFDRDAAHEVTLRNLLQRRGFEDLDAVRVEGKAEGRAEGKAEGRAEGKAEALLAVLEARGLTLDAAQVERIRTCAESATLDRWLRASVSVATAAELFAP